MAPYIEPVVFLSIKDVASISPTQRGCETQPVYDDPSTSTGDIEPTRRLFTDEERGKFKLLQLSGY